MVHFVLQKSLQDERVKDFMREVEQDRLRREAAQAREKSSGVGFRLWRGWRSRAVRPLRPETAAKS